MYPCQFINYNDSAILFGGKTGYRVLGTLYYLCDYSENPEVLVNKKFILKFKSCMILHR